MHSVYQETSVLRTLPIIRHKFINIFLFRSSRLPQLNGVPNRVFQWVGNPLFSNRPNCRSGPGYILVSFSRHSPEGLFSLCIVFGLNRYFKRMAELVFQAKTLYSNRTSLTQNPEKRTSLFRE